MHQVANERIYKQTKNEPNRALFTCEWGGRFEINKSTRRVIQNTENRKTLGEEKLLRQKCESVEGTFSAVMSWHSES